VKKPDAAAFLGVGVRTLENLQSRGRITPAWRDNGKSGYNDYDPADLERLKAELEAEKQARHQPTAALAVPAFAQIAPAPQWTALEAQLRAAGQGGTDQPRKPVASIADKLTAGALTVDEIHALTGFPTRYIRAAIDAGDLAAVKIGRSWRVHPARLAEWRDTVLGVKKAVKGAK